MAESTASEALPTNRKMLIDCTPAIEYLAIRIPVERIWLTAYQYEIDETIATIDSNNRNENWVQMCELNLSPVMKDILTNRNNSLSFEDIESLQNIAQLTNTYEEHQYSWHTNTNINTQKYLTMRKLLIDSSLLLGLCYGRPLSITEV